MITPHEFARAWSRCDETEPLVSYPAEILAGANIPESAKQFLNQAGLPKSAAPFLGFYTSDPPIEESEWYPSGYFEIGGNSYGDPIFIEESTGRVVFFNHDYHFEQVFMNSSVELLAELLLRYRELVIQTQQQNGADAWLDGHYPPHLIDAFEADLRRIDPAALEDGFWRQELIDMRSRRHRK
jgi:hypothetical protein